MSIARCTLCSQPSRLCSRVVVVLVGSPATFFFDKDSKKSKVKTSAALTNLDVLYAVLSTLMTFVTTEEWHLLGEGSCVQRCQKML